VTRLWHFVRVDELRVNEWRASRGKKTLRSPEKPGLKEKP